VHFDNGASMRNSTGLVIKPKVAPNHLKNTPASNNE
jgi:hypothetical protein